MEAPLTPSVSADEQGLVEQTAALQVGTPKVAEEKTQSVEPPPHRTHDPEKNLKRSDPFQFGSRTLGQDDDIYEFNAWDHVETDDAYKAYAEEQFELQRQSPVSDFDKSEFPLFYLNTTPPLSPGCHDDPTFTHSSPESL